MIKKIEQSHKLSPFLSRSRIFRAEGANLRFQDIEVLELDGSEWLSYFEMHGIDTAIGRRYCRRIRYMCRRQPCAALVFPNRSGGYAVYGQYHKGQLEPTDISLFYQKDKPAAACVFAHFMDFLAYKTLIGQGWMVPFAAKCDYIVLHTYENIPRATMELQRYKNIAFYLPHNDEWNERTANLKSCFADRAMDMSSIYSGYRSLQNFLLGRNR